MGCSDKCPMAIFLKDISISVHECNYWTSENGCLYAAVHKFQMESKTIKDCPTCKWKCLEGNDNPKWKLAHAHGKPTQYNNENCRFHENRKDKEGRE